MVFPRTFPEKGHLCLLEAIAALPESLRPLRLVLVGDGPAEQVLRERVEVLGLTRLVEFRGKLDEQATLQEIAVADVLVLPSFMEGLPVVLMEAMGIGVPVIASQVAGVPELVADDRTGLLVPPGEVQALSKAIARILSDPASRDRLATAGRKAVEEEFSIRVAVDALEPLLRGSGPSKNTGMKAFEGMQKIS